MYFLFSFFFFIIFLCKVKCCMLTRRTSLCKFSGNSLTLQSHTHLYDQLLVYFTCQLNANEMKILAVCLCKFGLFATNLTSDLETYYSFVCFVCFFLFVLFAINRSSVLLRCDRYINRKVDFCHLYQKFNDRNQIFFYNVKHSIALICMTK